MKVPRLLRDRRSYLQQFQRTASGEYIFVGNTFVYSDPEQSRRQTLTAYWIPAAVMSVGALGQGFLPAEGMLNCAYVLIPFVIGLLGALSVIWALVKLSLAKEPLREYEYTATVQALPFRSMLTFILACATLLGECVFLVIHGLTDPEWTLPQLALILLEAGAALISNRRMKNDKWQPCDQQN